MRAASFTPTPEQRATICHEGPAFISACPGAGKTRVMVERACHLFRGVPPGRGVAFLSFTRAAISELEARLRQRAVLPTPVYPSFIGTFDSFVWQFLIAPFGAAAPDVRPRLIPDIDRLGVTPFDGAQSLPLSCFDPSSGEIDHAAAKRTGFDPVTKQDFHLRAYKTAAATLRSRFRQQGQLGFDEARALALERLADTALSARLARALSGRFREVIVDEAQDCNPDDLTIIAWLRDAGLSVKVIGDPYQSIYQFRGGVTDELFAFRDQFDERDRQKLSGNFRSTRTICKAISRLRPPSGGAQPDEALGGYKDLPHAVHVLSYQGRAVPSSIGVRFSELVRAHGEDISACPVVAATRASGAAAVGKPAGGGGGAATLRLAEATMNFHYAPRFNQMEAAMETVHRLLLEMQGALSTCSYHQYLQEHEIQPLSWRPQVISILRDLKFDPGRFTDARVWHDHAKALIARHVTLEPGATIGQKLRWSAGIETMLSASSTGEAAAHTIHSVKGMEFPAVCVVTTAKTLGGILDFLENGSPVETAEDARELYVAASRAQKWLVFAVPGSQAGRFCSHLGGHGADITLVDI